MSTRKGGGEKHRAPAHQNTFAFRHNKKSKKTEAILKMPIEKVCEKCREKIIWRKKYRKYKPLTVPGVCSKCQCKTVRSAYHKICDACAIKDELCAMCLEHYKEEIKRKSSCSSCCSSDKEVGEEVYEDDKDIEIEDDEEVETE